MSPLLEKREPSETPETKPDIGRLADLFQSPLRLHSFALTGLFVLACFYTLYLGREFFLPVVLAVLLSFLLSPVVRGLKRLYIPEYLGAALVIISLFSALGGIAYELYGPVSDWLQKAPQIGQKLERDVRGSVEKVTKAGEQVRKLTQGEPAGQGPPQRVALQQPSILASIFSRTWNFLFELGVVIILLYFLLGSGDLFLRKLIHVLPSFRDKKTAVQIAREVEDNISRYLLTVAVINSCLGTAGGLAFWALGMPDPLLWGAMAALLNFVPFLGALTVIGVVTIVAVATFATLGHALLVPAAYLGLAILEGNFVTPMVMGQRLTLNPVVIFVALIFWGWMWGIPGALLAVPTLATLKIFCDHIEPLAAIGEFLGK